MKGYNKADNVANGSNQNLHLPSETNERKRKHQLNEDKIREDNSNNKELSNASGILIQQTPAKRLKLDDQTNEINRTESIKIDFDFDEQQNYQNHQADHQRPIDPFVTAEIKNVLSNVQHQTMPEAAKRTIKDKPSKRVKKSTRAKIKKRTDLKQKQLQQQIERERQQRALRNKLSKQIYEYMFQDVLFEYLEQNTQMPG
jgi:hypothetical protein